jgi:phage terminase large subunit-like protein
MAKQKIQKKISSIDRATAYARDVVSGKVVAGPFVRGACQRHLNDLQKAKADHLYPFEYVVSEAEAAFRFFEEYLFLNGGQFEGQPFLLLPWQCFVVGSLFGWKRKGDGMRRFRVAYIETPKGSGKSPLAAGVGLKGLVADREPRAEVYAAATFKDQAMVLFRDAIAFYDQSPELQTRLVASGVGDKRWKLSYPKNNSFFKVISSEKKGQSGPRPHIALLDEIHEHPDGTVIEMIRAGFKFRRQPLSFMITNSGHDKTSVCWEYHDMGAKIACEQIENDEFFALICSLDDEDLENDRYLEDETLWAKVNPSLDAGIPGYDYIRGQVKEARGMPSKMATVKRLCFCQWTEADNPAISKEAWMACQDKDYSVDILKGRRCWGGLDLSSVNDLTAFALMFEPEVPPKTITLENGKKSIVPFTMEEIADFVEEGKDPYFRLKVWFWIPGEGIRQKQDNDHVPYIAWRDADYLYAPKCAAISKAHVIKTIDEWVTKYDLQGIAYDRSRIKDLMEFAEKAGIELNIGKWDKEKREWKFPGSYGIKMMPFGQEPRSMAPAIDKFEMLLLEKLFRHDGNPVMTWCAASAVMNADEDGYRKVSKRKSTGRVDGLTATVMACGILDDGPPAGSVYDNLSKAEMIARMTGR